MPTATTPTNGTGDTLHATHPHRDPDHPSLGRHQRPPLAPPARRRRSPLSTYQAGAREAVAALLGRLTRWAVRAGWAALDVVLVVAGAALLAGAAWLVDPVAGAAAAGLALLALRLHWAPPPPPVEPVLTAELVDAIVSLHRSGLDTARIIATAQGATP